MMNRMIKTVIASGALALLPTHALAAGSTDPGDSCPAGQVWWLPDGADYVDGVWYVDGDAFGFAPTEDSCWTPIADVKVGLTFDSRFDMIVS